MIVLALTVEASFGVLASGIAALLFGMILGLATRGVYKDFITRLRGEKSLDGVWIPFVVLHVVVTVWIFLAMSRMERPLGGAQTFQVILSLYSLLLSIGSFVMTVLLSILMGRAKSR